MRSIREICYRDHKNDDSNIKHWLSNKTLLNFNEWIESGNNYAYSAVNTKGEIIGFGLMSKFGEILLNYVLPEYLHMGIGKRLLAKMEEQAQSEGINRLHADSTFTARSFYERNGFELNKSVEGSDELNCVPLIKYI